MFKRLRNDKTKIFYLNEEDAKSNETFAQVFITEEAADYKKSEGTNTDVGLIIEELMKFPTERELYQLLDKLPGL